MTEALTSPPERGWMTAGELRAALATLPDDAPAFVDGNPDRSIAFAYPTQQIHPDDVDGWEADGPLVRGLEVWLEDIDDPDAVRQWPGTFGDRRCLHGSTRPPSPQSITAAREALSRLVDQARETAGDYAGRQRVTADGDSVLRILEASRQEVSA